MQNFETIIKNLQDNNVEFIIIGGCAASAHGVTLLTQDAEIKLMLDIVPHWCY